MFFENRREAGHKLAEILGDFKNKNAIVLALPRGGVVVGAEIAKELNLPLDIVVTRKIGAPENEEYAIGAIDVEGEGVWSDVEIENINKEWLKIQIEKEKQEAQRRLVLYRGEMPPMDLRNKIVILVDDGIATGLTMKAAIKYANKFSPKSIIVATPVSAKEVADEIKKEVDEIRTLETSSFFISVSQFYTSFPQIEDDEVIKIMKRAA